MFLGVNAITNSASQTSVQVAAGWSSGAMVTRYSSALSHDLAITEFIQKMLNYTVFRELISIALPGNLTNRLTNQISHNAGEVTRALEPGHIPDYAPPQVS